MGESDRTGRGATIRLHGHEPIRARVVEDLGALLKVNVLDDPNDPALYAVGSVVDVLEDVTTVDAPGDAA